MNNVSLNISDTEKKLFQERGLNNMQNLQDNLQKLKVQKPQNNAPKRKLIWDEPLPIDYLFSDVDHAKSLFLQK